MSDNIPALIAEAREYADAISGGENENWMRLVQFVYEIAAALESLSAPSGDTDERSDLRDLIYHHEYIDGASGTMRDAEGLRDAILAAGFRRPSPVTREALADTLDALPVGTSTLSDYAPRREIEGLAEKLLEQLYLPEPAEVEWEYGHAVESARWGVFGAESREVAERTVDMWNSRTRQGLISSGHDDPGAALLLMRTPAGPWVPVKGTET